MYVSSLSVLTSVELGKGGYGSCWWLMKRESNDRCYSAEAFCAGFSSWLELWAVDGCSNCEYMITFDIGLEEQVCLADNTCCFRGPLIDTDIKIR